MTSAVFQGGGDYTATRFIIGSDENALMVRNFTGYRTWATTTSCNWSSAAHTATTTPA